MSENRKSAALILADGTVYRVMSFGAAGTVFGEIVFTTRCIRLPGNPD